jgi:hypothetical protein
MTGTNDQRALSKQMREVLSRGIPSDQMTVFYALAEYEKLLKEQRGAHHIRRFFDQNSLSRSSVTFLLELEKQLEQSLETSVGIRVSHSFHTRYDRDEAKALPLLISLIGFGLSSTVAVAKSGGVFVTEKGCKLRSLAREPKKDTSAGTSKVSGQQKELRLMGYQELISVPSSTKLRMMSTCPVGVYSYLLSCGSIDTSVTDSDDENRDSDESGVRQILVDGWLRLDVPNETLKLVMASRSCLEDALNSFVENPKRDLSPDRLRRLRAITEALISESQFNVQKTKPAAALSILPAIVA